MKNLHSIAFSFLVLGLVGVHSTAIASTLPEIQAEPIHVASLSGTNLLSAAPMLRRATPIIENSVDTGLIVEIFVRCGSDVGIITLSKVEQKFCTPDLDCYDSFKRASAPICGPAN